MGPSILSDADLVAEARAGHVASLGLLLERHRPRLLATAIRLLGYRSEAEDAVQETFLIAMRHLASVRDADAVGAWLHAVLRRECLQRRRRQRNEVLTDTPPERADERIGPEERIEKLELRDWIWTALQKLPEPLRATAMLRYFGTYDSYDEVSAILGVPIGTVRSRLSEAKVKLADALLASAGMIDDASRTRERERERFWMDEFRDVFRRGTSDRFILNFVPDLVVGWSNGKKGLGREFLAAEIEQDLDDNVRLEPERIVSNNGVAVFEGRFVNPPDDPDHCPPAIALVLFGAGDRMSRIRLHLAPRPPRAEG